MKDYWNVNVLIVVKECALLSFGYGSGIWNTTNLGAVTYFDGIEEYYRARRGTGPRATPREPTEPTKTAQVKQKICEAILTSHFFKMHRIEWANTEKKAIQDELRNNHRDIFYSMFEEYDYEYHLSSFMGHGYDYINPHRVRLILSGNNGATLDEYVFKCVARDRRSGILREYLVSQSYNVNEVSWQPPIAGRFIFSCSEDNRTLLTIVALAEESGDPFNFPINFLTTLFYLFIRMFKREIADAPQTDPICSLSPARKLRLCSILLGTPKINDEVIFFPLVEYVRFDCVKKSVSVGFLGRFTHQPVEEWVIGCKALNFQGTPIMYYVSQGVASNSVNVYNDASFDDISVYDFFVRVSVSRAMQRVNDNQGQGPGNTDVENRDTRFLRTDVED